MGAAPQALSFKSSSKVLTLVAPILCAILVFTTLLEIINGVFGLVGIGMSEGRYAGYNPTEFVQVTAFNNKLHFGSFARSLLSVLRMVLADDYAPVVPVWELDTAAAIFLLIIVLLSRITLWLGTAVALLGASSVIQGMPAAARRPSVLSYTFNICVWAAPTLLVVVFSACVLTLIAAFFAFCQVGQVAYYPGSRPNVLEDPEVTSFNNALYYGSPGRAFLTMLRLFLGEGYGHLLPVLELQGGWATVVCLGSLFSRSFAFITGFAALLGATKVIEMQRAEGSITLSDEDEDGSDGYARELMNQSRED